MPPINTKRSAPTDGDERTMDLSEAKAANEEMSRVLKDRPKRGASTAKAADGLDDAFAKSVYEKHHAKAEGN